MPNFKKSEWLALAEKYKLMVEDNSINIFDSISQSEYIISEYSTVMYQAFLIGRGVILDDTRKGIRDKLMELDFRMLKTDRAIPLSDFVSG